MLTHYLRLREGRLEVAYRKPDRSFADDTLASLRSALAALTAYFEIDAPFPVVRAVLAAHRDDFDALVADLLGVPIERPSDPRRIAQPQRTDIVFLSPAAYATQAAYDYVPCDYARMVHHELVHVVQEHLSPGIEDSPLWWDEGLAVYLSDQWRHASQFRFREPVLQSLWDGSVPTFSAIQTDGSLAYSFGWTIVRFIEQELGKDAIVRVVKQMRDGHVLSALGERGADVPAQWRTWLLTSDLKETDGHCRGAGGSHTEVA